MHNIELLNKFLKDELSATETYQQALDKLKENADLGNSEYLSPIFYEHKEAVSSIQALINQLGGTPSEDSGVWGSWAQIVVDGAKLLGNSATLKVLQEGEKNGADDYEKALLDTELSVDIRTLIESKLLVSNQANIRTLDQLLDTAKAA
ncbi:DUF2383 domain-containing protein [Methylomonas sp. AM2-LC]|uniref:DUF2383 domain-containing protein n=1 Tax=Methylomonas sp. AM2-LC TaxID=3153301 RepID=UPI0032662AFA